MAPYFPVFEVVWESMGSLFRRQLGMGAYAEGSIRENGMPRVDRRLLVQGCSLSDIITARSEELTQMRKGMALGLLYCVGPSESWLKMSFQPMQYAWLEVPGIATMPWHALSFRLRHFTLDNHFFLILNTGISVLTLT